ncbi:MAG: D-alanine--D-alanine ligase [Sinomicrobium sp.]|nr:D-alanine--D-alanine ligase [Sinomicrobium sp.]
MKKNIAIIMGGYSSEYGISIKSGNVVFKHLDREKYAPYRIIIARNKWVYLDENDRETGVNRHDFTIALNGKTIVFDCVFNAIHGTPGEDGYMQAYLALLGIPHTSCDYYQAALTFNKRDCLAVLKPYEIPCAASYYLNKGDAIASDAIIAKVGLPCFVKANRSGSSYGVSKVNAAEALIPAIENAFTEDDEVLIEAFLDGTEVSVGVITYKGEVTVLPATEIISENEFFDYEAKYLGKSREITPARIPAELAARLAETARKVYTALNLKGFSRSEYIFVDGIPHLLEVNTIPGLTEESLLPQQARAAGIALSELFENAIEAALDSRHRL